MWITALAAAVGLYVVAAVLKRQVRRRRRVKAQHVRCRKEKERERRREAFYMQNFWSYDGSEQEEFEE